MTVQTDVAKCLAAEWHTTADLERVTGYRPATVDWALAKLNATGRLIKETVPRVPGQIGRPRKRYRLQG